MTTNKNKKERQDILLNSDFVKVNDIAEMIDEQTRKLSEAEASYDYRELFKEDNLSNISSKESSYFLGKHLHKPLAELLERVLKIDPQKNVNENHKARLKLQMIIGILCNIKNQKCSFVKNMIGLTLFSGHVKDKVCDLLAMFGITTTSRTIRNLIHKWSEKRDAISELDKKSFWRFSFDNLNFLRKYANTFKSGGKVIGRMLNLLTGQLIHKAKDTSESQAIGNEEVRSLSGLKPGDF